MTTYRFTRPHSGRPRDPLWTIEEIAANCGVAEEDVRRRFLNGGRAPGCPAPVEFGRRGGTRKYPKGPALAYLRATGVIK